MGEHCGRMPKLGQPLLRIHPLMAATFGLAALLAVLAAPGLAITVTPLLEGHTWMENVFVVNVGTRGVCLWAGVACGLGFRCQQPKQNCPRVRARPPFRPPPPPPQPPQLLTHPTRVYIAFPNHMQTCGVVAVARGRCSPRS